MTLESIGKLREFADWNRREHGWKEKLRGFADEIEREVGELQRNYEFLQRTYDAAIADRNANWMKLPVDADGEVIHIGDTVYNDRWTCGREVYEIAYQGNERWGVYVGDGIEASAWLCHHRKPTVEDVLHDYANAYMQIDGQNTDELDAEYVDKLREAVRAE